MYFPSIWLRFTNWFHHVNTFDDDDDVFWERVPLDQLNPTQKCCKRWKEKWEEIFISCISSHNFRSNRCCTLIKIIIIIIKLHGNSNKLYIELKIDQIHWRFIKAPVWFEYYYTTRCCDKRQNAVYTLDSVSPCFERFARANVRIWSVTDRRLFVQFMKYYFSDLLRSHLHAKMSKCVCVCCFFFYIAFVLFTFCPHSIVRSLTATVFISFILSLYFRLDIERSECVHLIYDRIPFLFSNIHVILAKEKSQIDCSSNDFKVKKMENRWCTQ